MRKYDLFKKIIVVLSIFILLTSFVVSPSVEAASIKTELEEGEFYYSGTTEGSYKISESIFDWLLTKMGEIADFLLGLMTMGGRMVIVGWTALVEEFVTWCLEATTGVPMNVEEINSTELDGFINSSNNVTIEAIVFNRVPILNINLFENSIPDCVSGTGQFFVECETCYNAQLAAEGRTAPNNTREKRVCRMQECDCADCLQFLEGEGLIEVDASGNVTKKANAITIVKDNVAKWYYIMRLIAIAAMLLVLIVVGIKMAISSAASDKALYKRMLVDWVVAMVLIFFIHFFMVFVIHMNEMLVEFIRDVETGVSDIVKKEFYIDTKSNEDLEISIYQAVRTRAYDAKLINGTTGMVLYITLLFYTIRFIFTYLKRYLTIIILTLMAPGIAFSYAIQKVLSGKSQAFSSWLSDYFINVVIQTVHALVYSIFVSTALIISLNSISGMIMAFVFMNFMLKADDIFRKIFKLSSSSTEEAMGALDSVKNLKNEAKSAVTFMTAGNMLKKSPITKAPLAPLKMAGTGAVIAAASMKSRLDDRKEKKNNSGSKNTKNSNTQNSNTQNENVENSQYNMLSEALLKRKQRDKELWNIAGELKKIREKIDPSGKSKKEFDAFLDYYSEKEGVSYDGEDAIEKEMTDLEKLAFAKNDISNADRKKLQQLREDFDSKTNMTTGEFVKGHLEELFDVRKYKDYDASKGKYKAPYGIFGKREFDRQENKWVRHTMSELVAEQLKPENLLGFTDADKKMWKEVKGLAKGTLLGMGSLFVGLGTVVSNPAAGMGLLANGMNSMITFADKTGVLDHTRTYRTPVVDEKQKKFSFKRFGKGAKQNITKSILENVEKEQNRAVVENVRKNHKTLYRTLRLGGAGIAVTGAIGLGAVGATPIVAGIVIGTGVATNAVGKGIKHYSGYSKNSLFGKISKQHFKQLKDLKNELVQDEIRLVSKDEANEIRDTYAQLFVAIDTSLNVINSNVESKTNEQQSNEEKSEQERKEERKIASEAGDTISLENGEEIVLVKPAKVLKNRKLDSYAERCIIDEAVAKTIVSKYLKEVSIQNFDPEKIHNDAKEMIEKKLGAYGFLSKDANEKIDTKIKDLDKKIDLSTNIILRKEFGLNLGEEDSELEDIEIVDEENTNIEKTENQKPQVQKRKATAFEQALIAEVIKEKIERKEIKKATDISIEMVIEEVQEKRRIIAGRQSSEAVIQNMQAAKDEIPVQQSFEKLAEITPERLEAIKNEITDIKRINRPEIPKTDKARREEKKRRISDLENVLIAMAGGENQVQDETNPLIHKSTNEVIEELFENKEQQSKVYQVLNNINNIKRLNRRGESLKMKSSDSDYHYSKRVEKVQKAYAQYPELVESLNKKRAEMAENAQIQQTTADKVRDKEYKNYDQSKVYSKDVYGPVTDVVDLIKELSNDKLEVRRNRSRNRARRV